MSRTRVVLRQQDVTGMDGDALATACLEFQCTGERDDKTRDRILVPLIGAAGFGLLEGQTDAAEHVAQKVASLAPGKIDCSFLVMRVAIVAGPQSHTPDHDVFLSVQAPRGGGRRCQSRNGRANLEPPCPIRQAHQTLKYAPLTPASVSIPTPRL